MAISCQTYSAMMDRLKFQSLGPAEPPDPWQSAPLPSDLLAANGPRPEGRGLDRQPPALDLSFRDPNAHNGSDPELCDDGMGCYQTFP